MIVIVNIMDIQMRNRNKMVYNIVILFSTVRVFK